MISHYDLVSNSMAFILLIVALYKSNVYFYRKTSCSISIMCVNARIWIKIENEPMIIFMGFELPVLEQECKQSVSFLTFYLLIVFHYKIASLNSRYSSRAPLRSYRASPSTYGKHVARHMLLR